MEALRHLLHNLVELDDPDFTMIHAVYAAVVGFLSLSALVVAADYVSVDL